MKILLLDGNPKKQSGAFDEFLHHLRSRLQESHYIDHIALRELNYKGCTGCFGCWVKRPGQCIIDDDTLGVRELYINSDLVIYASPIIMGFTSGLLKTAQDKLIPLLHPNFELVNGEIHHQPRYKKYPKIALLLGPEAITDDEDIEIITSIYERIAINFKTKLSFIKFTTSSTEELSDAINSI